MDGTPFIAPFVPCPGEVIPHALEIAEIKADDTVVDLGCGDARILREAIHLQPPPRALIGVELDPHLCKHARQNAAQSLLAINDISSPRRRRVQFTIYEQDMFTVDLERLGATVLILYLLPAGLAKLSPTLRQWLNSKSSDGNRRIRERRRIVTINYAIPEWPIKKTFALAANGYLIHSYA